jgi:hypothetical protein
MQKGEIMKKILLLIAMLFIFGCGIIGNKQSYYGLYTNVMSPGASIVFDAEKIVFCRDGMEYYSTRKFIIGYITKSTMNIIFMKSMDFPIAEIIFYKVGGNTYAFIETADLEFYYRRQTGK